ncbi:glycosyltransferase family 25 protein [Phycisphaera mikurensis]|nr:glycosyltransferase family 25 protein [Phycisphaera mikurensis]MBB6440762.1 glycosyl transferase family 25 [Phycisphaera mikurensis]
MKAYAINLDGETQRWERLLARFAPLGIEPERVPGVDGRALTLPHPMFDEAAYERYHGRRIAMGKVGVFQSQIRMIRRFHGSDPARTGEAALFLEDDVRPEPDLPGVLAAAMEQRRHWDVLRLSGLSEAKPLKLAPLTERHHLALTCDRLKGAGGYLMNRRAAAVFAERVPPQWLPWDHHIDREWWFGLKAARVRPFPIDQTGHSLGSSTSDGKPAAKQKLPAWRRWATTYPYQTVNDGARWAVKLTRRAAGR